MRKQSGFTLVEIAIVLVIVGLLLGGILKGQELINSARVKSYANDIKSIPVFLYGYQDRFRALPGDDSNPANHVTGAAAASTPASSLGNGRIDGSWDSATQTDESVLFWQHVRLANLAPGSTNPADANFLPRNSEGGRIGISSNAPITGMTGTFFVCSGSVLGRYVRQLDTTLDDGNTDGGSVRAALGSAPSTAVASAAIVDSSSYNVCMAF